MLGFLTFVTLIVVLIDIFSIRYQYKVTHTDFPTKIYEECAKLETTQASADCINTDLAILSRLEFIALMRIVPLITQLIQLIFCWLNQSIVDFYLVSNPVAFLNLAVIGAFLAYNHAKFDSVKPDLPDDINEISQRSVFEDELTWQGKYWSEAKFVNTYLVINFAVALIFVVVN